MKNDGNLHYPKDVKLWWDRHSVVKEHDRQQNLPTLHWDIWDKIHVAQIWEQRKVCKRKEYAPIGIITESEPPQSITSYKFLGQKQANVKQK